MPLEKAIGQSLNPNVSVDCVIFGFDFDELKVLLIEREIPEGIAEADSPRFALPGNLVRDDETLDESAQRVLNELTGLKNIFLEQYRAFGDPGRVRSEGDRAWLLSTRTHPEARVITVAYYSLIKLEDFQPSASSFARKVVWVPVSSVPKLGFDHNQILSQALTHLKNKLVNRPVGFELLPEKFTLSQLQKVYETILGTMLDKRNFRRKIFNMGILLPLEEKQTGVPHKPARLYRFDRDRYQELLDSDLVFAV